MGNKKAKDIDYVVENLEFFGRNLVNVRTSLDRSNCPYTVKLDYLEKAIKNLPRKDRENIEKFWGLTGGPNHSKKIAAAKDVAFITMRDAAITSMKKLFKLDYVFMYDEHLKSTVNLLMKKINKNGVQICDLDAIKYLIMFLVILQNGPKMSFEEDPMAIDTDCRDDFTFDEYAVIEGAYREFKDWPDKCINLQLIKTMLEMLDFKDALAVQKSFEIPIPKEYRSEEIKTVLSFGEVRDFKERVFPFGSWDVSTALIFGNIDGEVKLDGFMEALDEVRKDWSKIADFKTSQKKLQTAHELRTLDVYTIGGLEFTDIYEVMFLYLERNHIEP